MAILVDFISLNPLPPGTSSFLDDFPGTAVDSGLWTPDSAIACADSNLQMDVSGAYVYSNAIYDVSGGWVVLHITGLGDFMDFQGHATLPALQIGSLAFGDQLDDYATVLTGNYSASFAINPISGVNKVYPFYSHDNGAGSPVGVAVTSAAETLALPAHAYLRLRDAAGTFYWERSADGVTWTVMHSITRPADWNLQRCILELSEYTL